MTTNTELKDGTIRVLHIEDSAADAESVRRLLATSASVQFHVEQVPTLAAGLARLATSNPVDVALLDEGLPDASPGEALLKMRSLYPQVPVVVLTGALGIDAGPERVRKGAQDFLQKNHFNGTQLIQVLCFAVARAKQTEEAETIRLREQHEREISLLERLTLVLD